MISPKIFDLSERISGIPLVSRGQEISELGKEFEKRGEKVVDLKIGEPYFDTPENIKQAAVKALGEGQTHYTSNRGLLEIREAFAEKLRKDNSLIVDPKTELMLTNGGKLSLFLAVMVIINPGDEVLLTDPCFGAFASIVKLAGGTPVYAPCIYDSGRFRPDIDALKSNTSARTKILIINSPSNPTGTVFTKAELEAIGEFACSNNLIIISDETYEKIIYDDQKHYSIAALAPEFQERTVTVGSLSKTYAMTGWRVGYLVAQPTVIKAAAYLTQSSARMVSAFIQFAAKEAVSGSQDAVVEMVSEYDKRRKVIVEGLNSIPRMECAYPEGAFYVFPRIEQFGLTSLEFANHLVRTGGVASIPGDFYGPAGEGHIRLSFATDTTEIDLGIERIQIALDHL